jgi:formylglycine-generating enzyme required for sulfatase activity
MAERFDPYYQWLSIPPEEQPPNHYRLLGTRLFEDNPGVIESAADRQMAHLRSFQTGPRAALSQKLLNEVAAAKVCLLNRAKKAAYDAQLQASLSSSDESFGRKMAELLADASAPRSVGQARSKMPVLLAAGATALVLMGAAVWAFARRAEQRPAEDRAAASALPNPQIERPAVDPPTAPIAKPAAKPEPPVKPKPVEPAVVAPIASPPVTVAEPPPAVPVPRPATALASVDPNPVDPKPAAASPPVPDSPPASKRLPTPPEAALSAGLKIAREAYQDEYARATTPAARRAIAKEMLQKATENKDDAVARFVLLRLARDIALAADDTSLAHQAIDRLAEGFEVDPWTMRAEIVSTAAKAARKSADHKAVAEQALALMRGALEHDACEVAQEMAKLALAEGGRVRDKELVTQARAGQKQAQQAAKNLSQVESARAVLKATPTDPAAHLTVGRYECFVKGDWPAGLAHLVQGRDTTLAALAREDLAGHATLQLADAWWDVAQRNEGRERESMLLRAGYWYQQLDEIDQPLVQTKVENRLAQIAKLGRPIPGPAAKKTFTNSIGMKFVLIPAGEFLMGSTPEELTWAKRQGTDHNERDWYFERLPAEGPRHPITITRPLYLAVYEVTQGEYEQVMGANPSWFSEKGKNAAQVAGHNTGRNPVEYVSYNEASQFCLRLSALPRERAARRAYRLPTEAEWEYAARAGSLSRWYFGDDITSLQHFGWVGGASGRTTQAVGQKRANAWGLYDMYGNVWEWCMDYFSPDFYSQSPSADPVGPPAGSDRVVRGGSLMHPLYACRSAFRHHLGASARSENVGFRVVCVR